MNILRNLEVPYFSQRNNQTVWNEKYLVDTNEVDSEGNSLAGKLLSNGKTDSKAICPVESSPLNEKKTETKQTPYIGSIAMFRLLSFFRLQL